jgi:formyltetrahydrofolate deformylase
MTRTYILTFTCDDQAGVIHSITGAVLEIGGNILEQAQFTDEDSGQFCLRTRFESEETQAGRVEAIIAERTAHFAPTISLRPEEARRRALIMVSAYDHCLVDLLYRHGTGELRIDIPVVVSNHDTLRTLVESHGIPFVHLPITPDTKPAQEAELLRLVAENAIDVVVLARYMQVLSDSLCRELSGRVINIHHSFLPGFKGARPYHQAHARGVKLIGATAHFVTADLDEGPIIEQEVERVDHSHTAEALAEIGRDVERLVLSRAVRYFAEDRILLTGQRTVVFA